MALKAPELWAPAGSLAKLEIAMAFGGTAILTQQAATEWEVVHERAEVFLIEESQRPGSSMPVEEDEHGTDVMNSKDLRAVEHVKRLVEIGVDSLKIEGRTNRGYTLGFFPRHTPEAPLTDPEFEGTPNAVMA